MYLRKVIIADASEDFRIALEACLNPYFQVRSCSDGVKALALVREWEPDVLVMDPLLAQLDGISLLRQISGQPYYPKVLLVTHMSLATLNAVLLEQQIDYAIRKPCQISNVVARLQEMTAGLTLSPVREARYKSAASDTLMELGLPNRRTGFQHLLTGLPLLMEQRDQRLSKELYRTIAAISGSTTSGVEKAIREAIHAGWDCGDREVWNRYFPGGDCPRNKEFLFRITDLLLQKVG